MHNLIAQKLSLHWEVEFVKEPFCRCGTPHCVDSLLQSWSLIIKHECYWPILAKIKTSNIRKEKSPRSSRGLPSGEDSTSPVQAKKWTLIGPNTEGAAIHLLTSELSTALYPIKDLILPVCIYFVFYSPCVEAAGCCLAWQQADATFHFCHFCGWCWESLRLFKQKGEQLFLNLFWA